MLLSWRWRVLAPINQLDQLRRLRQECLSGKLIAASWNLWSHYFLLRPYACEGEGWRRGNGYPVLEKDTSTFNDPAEKTRCDFKCTNFCPSILKAIDLKSFQPVLRNQLASFFTVMKAGSDSRKLHLKSTEEEKEEGKMWKRFIYLFLLHLQSGFRETLWCIVALDYVQFSGK